LRCICNGNGNGNQIRLWGVEAQRRIQQSKVLVYGLGGLHAEVAKNLVLAGINVTVQDPAVATAHDLSSQFMLDEASVGKHVRSKQPVHWRFIALYLPG
jgi:ubiquitin-like 1-activating enzyme E1 A